MTIRNLPTDERKAIEFAKFEHRKKSRFWPRLIVRCLEARAEGKALAVAQDIYTSKSREEPVIMSLMHELDASLEGGTDAQADKLRGRASEIWNDPRCRSLSCRGVTRLFGAAASLLERDLEDYEIEITRAIGMLTASGDVGADDHEFATILQLAQEEFEE